MKSTTTAKTASDRSFERNACYHRRFALLAAMQAKRVLPLFEKERPKDHRPRQAVEAIHAWAQEKRELGMAEVRRLSLGAHASARKCASDAARFAARAAGHAVATWHVPTHAMGVPMYACTAIIASRNTPPRKRSDTHRPTRPYRTPDPRHGSCGARTSPRPGRRRFPETERGSGRSGPAGASPGRGPHRRAPGGRRKVRRP